MAKVNFEKDELFDKKLIESMNRQMQPREEVVSDLLAKIAELEASEAKVVYEVEEKPRFTLRSIPKRVWFYSTCAVAAAIVLVSTFAVFGGNTPDDVKNAFNNVVDNPNVVANQNSDIVKPNENEKGDAVKSNDENDKNVTVDSKDNKKNNKKDKNGKKGKDSKSTDQNDDQNLGQEGNDNQVDQNQETSDPNQLENQDPSNLDAKDPNSQEENQEVTNPLQSMVGAINPITNPVEGLDKFEEPAEIVTIEGSNFIIGSETKTATLSEESSISLEVPTASGSVRRLKAKSLASVSPNLMMAVMPENEPAGEEHIILYTNADYTPATLGQFMQDAGFDTITDYGYNGNSGMLKRGKRDITKSWKWTNYKANDVLKESFTANILAYTDAVLASNSYFTNSNTKVEFESVSNATGLTLYFGVTSTGYLNVKLEDSDHTILNEYTFNVGKENARLFIFDVTGE